jgi:hypothetical protein
VRHADDDDDDPPEPQFAPAADPEREALWTLHRDRQRIRCELRYHGEYGVEYRLFQNDQFYRGRGLPTRTLAVEAADIVRRQLEEDGWSRS